MTERIAELLDRNLQEVFGEGDAARRRAAIEEFYIDDCVVHVRMASLLDTTPWTNSPGNYARPIRISSIHPMGNPKPSTTPESLRGAPVRKASRPNTPGSMSSSFVRTTSLRCTSFSIRNCRPSSQPLIALSSAATISANLVRRDREVRADLVKAQGFADGRAGVARPTAVRCSPSRTTAAGPRRSTSSPTATWTVEEYSVGDLLSVRPYRGSFEPVSVVPTSARE